MRSLSFVLEQVEFILAGHGYDVGTDPRGEPGGDTGDDGVGIFWILAALVAILVAVGALVSLDPSGAKAKARKFGPLAAILVVIAAPLIAWPALSGADDESLIVERWINDDGVPELIVSLGEKSLNTMEETDGKRVVRLECLDGEDEVVLDAEKKWPFVVERGYDYPHAHQVASRDELRRVDSCRLYGTRAHLEADVKGVVTE